MNRLPFPVELAPSILSADFARLGEEIAQVEEAGCRVLHLDIMDGHLVPNISFGPVVCASIRRVTDCWLDAHLMIEEPEKFLEDFRRAGVDGITVHWEIPGKCIEVLKSIRAAGLSPGVSLRPSTPVGLLRPALELVDVVLMMSVEPGFGGQAFLPESPARIAELAGMIEESGRLIRIAVDGGINEKNAPLVVEAGASRLIAGSAIFRGDVRRNVRDLLAAAVVPGDSAPDIIG